MKLTLAVAVILYLIPLTAWALDDSPANRKREAERYVQATFSKELFQDAIEMLAKNVPAEQRELFKSRLVKNTDLDAVADAMKEAAAKTFTADELNALADFYSSPIGKSINKKQSAYQAEFTPTMQAEITKALSKADSNN